ncbi:hypothetical protein B9Z55_016023 [Caenorhabditis nigoni]|uniref:Uncharacterized protein n=1 Tax=Caenorhabditis nigoni TaxID=1611254 RepID=A0A2G5UCY2_9PELO|nr:hypothetical protein B9Z55_016023 [Caenorhabditis nigoni]
MKILQFLMISMLLVLSNSYILERLSDALPDYQVSRSSKIFFISAEPQKNLDMAQLHLMNGMETRNLTTYNQLELDMEIFNFQSNGIDVKYEISYGMRQGVDFNYSGLWMTRSYPRWPDYQAKEYGILNNQNDPITLSMMCRFPIHTNLYTVNITLINSDKSIQPPIIINSTSDIFVKSVSAFSGIKIEGGGPYSIQYELWDPLATTVGYETSTKSGGSFNFWICLVLAGILNFLL